jgi:hypothetical protein
LRVRGDRSIAAAVRVQACTRKAQFAAMSAAFRTLQKTNALDFGALSVLIESESDFRFGSDAFSSRETVATSLEKASV